MGSLVGQTARPSAALQKRPAWSRSSVWQSMTKVARRLLCMGGVCPSCRNSVKVLSIKDRNKMDPIDYQILDLLQRDARTTQVQIAAAGGPPPPNVGDRHRTVDPA